MFNFDCSQDIVQNNAICFEDQNLIETLQGQEKPLEMIDDSCNLCSQNEFQDQQNDFRSENFVTGDQENQNEDYIDPFNFTQSNKISNVQIDRKVPGETKNLPKCFARQLQQFIESSAKNSDDPDLKQTLDHPIIQKFLKLNPDKMGRAKLVEFINTSIGQIFCKEFFGNCQWNYKLTKESKTNIELCFRYNISYYLEAVKKVKLNQD